MKPFMDQDFLLETETARQLYHQYAEPMPIVDYHCHINPQEIAENRQYDNITQVWLGGDHYKWRAMRCNGVQEVDITGSKDTDPYRTFSCWAKTLPRCVGNPLYHWTYLELKRYFGVEEPLNPKTCQKIYDHCNQMLKQDSMRVRGIIQQSNVRLICTTDDPADSLEYHQQIAQDESCTVQVLPACRPDQAMRVEAEGFAAYLEKLGQAAGMQVNSFETLCQALAKRLAFFEEMGCRASDHALDHPIYRTATPEQLEEIFQKGRAGQPVSLEEQEAYKTALLLFLSKEYHRYGWVMQLHFGCIRNLSTQMYQKLGPDTGFDAVGSGGYAQELANLLDAMQQAGHLSKMVLYSLNQYDNEMIATIAGAFQTDSPVASRIQLGSAWWFNDTKTGMEKQLTDLGNLGVLGNFVGMLTDSRSFLSYTRHEYFRRILCNHLGNLVESGQYHNDLETLGELVQDICYNNTVKFFGFKL